jgi:hypothetical protein
VLDIDFTKKQYTMPLRARACDITLDGLNDFVGDIKENDLNAYLALNTVIYPNDLNDLRLSQRQLMQV